MPKIKLGADGIQIPFEAKDNLMQVLVQKGLVLDNPCNGNGTCGKCKVKVLEGDLPPVTSTEKRHLKAKELQENVRLACLLHPEKDVVLAWEDKHEKSNILTTGHLPAFEFQPDIFKKTGVLPQASMEDQMDYEEALLKGFGCNHVDWRVLTAGKRRSGEVTGIIHGNTLIGIEEGNTTDQLYGIAIDIGTTTVVAALIEMQTGDEIAVASMVNPQKQYGSDVLTRITYGIDHPETAPHLLKKVIVEGINELIAKLADQAEISQNEIYQVVIAGNTTMLHFLLGIDASVIGKAPYAPVFVRSKTMRATDIGLHVSNAAMLYCLPSVSAYIGADIVAGSYVAGMHEGNGSRLLIDIGTNGEIVLAHEGRILSCSCAAGPALEGMNIEAGMRAQEGAVEEVEITTQGIAMQTIGNKEAKGICGSGILAVLRELLRVGLVNPRGTFVKKEELAQDDYRQPMLLMQGKKRAFILSEEHELIVTQSDIRQVQLAKGAILSGFLALVKEAGLTLEELDEVIVAGQFGAHLSAESLIGTGILPEAVRGKLKYIGNASKTGAYMALMSQNIRTEMEDLASRIEYTELSVTENYERLFSKSLLFKA